MATRYVVIGGGILGTACAYWISCMKEAGDTVDLIEKSELSSGASAAPRAHYSLYERLSPWHMELARESGKIYESLLESGFKRSGGTILIENKVQREQVNNFIRKCAAADLQVDFLDQRQMKQIQPILSDSPVLGALYLKEEGQIDPFKAVLTFAELASAKGAKIRLGQKVKGFQMGNREITAVITEKETVPADVVINAAGSWSGSISEMAGVRIPVRNHKGMAMVSVPTPLKVYGSVIGGDVLGPGQGDKGKFRISLGLNHMENGSILISQARVEEKVEASRNVLLKEPVLVSRRLLASIPGLKNLQILRCWSAPTPFCEDGMPIYGWSEKCLNLFHLCSFPGALSTAPSVARKAADEIINGKKWKISGCSPDRR